MLSSELQFQINEALGFEKRINEDCHFHLLLERRGNATDKCLLSLQLILGFIDFLKVVSDVGLNLFGYFEFIHGLVCGINLILIFCFLLADDLELLDKDTEQNGIDDCIDYIYAYHHNHLRVGSGVHFDKHEGYSGVVPACSVLI